jgi:glycosyltransferase involved in cell wall biosynthesis
MNVLIVHQNFPGQFRHIARRLAAAGHEVLGLGEAGAPGLPGIKSLRYKISNRPTPSNRYLGTVQNGALHGEVVAKLLLKLKTQGYTPDVILAHPGWGEALFVKDVHPQARLVSLFEFYYHARGADVGFEPGSRLDFDLAAVQTTRNLLHLMNLERCDAGVSPTKWQRSLHPQAYQAKLRVIHEGIDTALLCPDAAASFALPDGRVLTRADTVLTYVARHLEPYRGFHVFMRALPEIQRRNPGAVTVIVGGDGVSYGRKPEGAANWREKLLAEVGSKLDLARVVFTGQLPYEDYRSLLRVSTAHAYLTYPFVLSWSALEAMACGCLLVASNTPPVAEVMRHDENALLFDFFDEQALAARLTQALSRPGDHAPLRLAARETVVRGYGVEQGTAAYMALLGASQPKTQP